MDNPKTHRQHWAENTERNTRKTQHK